MVFSNTMIGTDDCHSSLGHLLIESIVAALDGQLKHEDTNLASSTLIHDPTQKENLGIIVQYKVKVSIFTILCFKELLYSC